MAHKLLLADDSVTIQRVIELTFADEDVEVTAVGDGQLAIDRLDTDPPDIILADVDMPKRDGYEVAAYVKSRPKLAHIPVVLLTGAFEPIDQARAAAAGSSDVLAKPFEPQMVINRVKELLGRKRPDDEDLRLARSRGDSPVRRRRWATRRRQPRAGDAGSTRVARRLFRPARRGVLESAARRRPPSDGSDEVDWPADRPLQHRAASHSAAGRQANMVPAAPPVASTWRVPAVAAAPHRRQPVSTSPASHLSRPSHPSPLSHLLHLSHPSAPHRTSSHRFAQPLPRLSHPSHPLHLSHPSHQLRTARRPLRRTSLLRAGNPFANLSAAKAEAAARPAAPVITDEVIEEIVSRVLQRMTDRVVRETVTDIVSQTAERLVQEEIERIRIGIVGRIVGSWGS